MRVFPVVNLTGGEELAVRDAICLSQLLVSLLETFPSPRLTLNSTDSTQVVITSGQEVVWMGLKD